MSFVPLKEVLIKVLKRRGLCGDENFLKILSKWEMIVGEKLSSNSFPERIKKDTLYIVVKDPVFIPDFQFRKDLILKSIEEVTGIRLKDLKFVFG